MKRDGFRLLEGDEIDTLYNVAKTAVESLRDARNSTLTLGDITDHSAGNIICEVHGLNAVPDIEGWTRRLKKAIRKEVKLSQETTPVGTARWILVLPLWVRDESGKGQQQQQQGSKCGNPVQKPSNEKAAMLLVLLVVFVAVLWSKL